MAVRLRTFPISTTEPKSASHIQDLRMVGGSAEICFKARLPRRCCAGPASRLESHEDGVNFFEKLRIIQLHLPPTLLPAVLLSNPKPPPLLSFHTILIS